MEIIHIVLGKANPNRLNGVNKVVYHLASEQVKAGQQVQLWGITMNMEHDYPSRNFKTVLFKKKRFPFQLDQELKLAIHNHRDAVFHLHGGWIPEFNALARYMSRLGVRYVLTPHGAYNPVAIQRSLLRKRIYFTFFEKKLLRYAYRVHSIGESEVKGLHDLYPYAWSVLLPYGFECTEATEPADSEQAFTIGYMGRLDVHTKGLDLLLAAFRRFQKAHPDSRLWIIGDGPGMPYMKKSIVQLGLEHTILWGKKFGEEKNALISQLHVFAHPSRNEGLPTAVLEAANLGVPVIVTEATNTADYVRKYDAGIAIANESTDELHLAMETLYNAYQDQKMTQYAIGAKKMLSEAFAWPGLVEQYKQLYR